MALYRDFLSYTTDALRELGLSFGQMPLILYIGKHPGCTQAELTRALKLDWGYSQRSVGKLAEAGFLVKTQEKTGNCLSLTEAGREVFETSHRVFLSWDQLRTDCLTPEEKDTLLLLLSKITPDRKES